MMSENANDEAKRKNGINNRKLPLKKLVVWICVHITYTFLGALLFVYLEECAASQTHTPTGKFREFMNYLGSRKSLDDNEVKRILNETRGFFVKAVTARKSCEFTHEAIAKWWAFTTVTCYTIGYGNVVPKTDYGKIATIFYAIIGIPLTIVLYTVTADFMEMLVGAIICLVEKRLLKRKTVRNVTSKTLATLVILLIVYLCIVSYINTREDEGNLRAIDSVYYWFQTLTTIGYGDVQPVYTHNDFIELIMRVIFAFGMGITASIISALARLVNKFNGKRMRKILSFSNRSYEFKQHEHRWRQERADDLAQRNLKLTSLRSRENYGESMFHED
eukprot:gene13843-15289_t